VKEAHFEAALAKVHAMMNENLREYYRRMREVFKGGLPKEVQPPEYQ
jgi:transitional endoplasmic reticulum ATPase